MLKRAPSVYVPIEPDDNGVTLPTILSLLVHGSILAFIILSHQIPKIDTPPSIETSLVTPEELATMQAEIADNRINAESLGDATHFDSTLNESELSSTITTDEPETDSLASTVLRRTVNVFTKSDEPADSITESNDSSKIEDVPEDNGYDAEYAEQRKRYEAAKDAFQRQVDAEMAEKERIYKEYLAERDKLEKERLRNYKEKGTTPPIVEKPKSNNQKPASSKPSNETTKNKNRGFDLGENGKPLNSSSSASSAASGSSSGTNNANDIANISSELVGLIKPYWTPPANRVGQTVSASIQVDAGGMVVSASVNTSDQALKQSLEDAIEAASPLTPLIGTDLRRIKLNFVVE